MGWFNFKCSHCNNAISHGRGIDNETVVIADGLVAEGMYNDDVCDRIILQNEIEVVLNELDFNIYHKKCWDTTGKPTKYDGSRAISGQFT